MKEDFILQIRNRIKYITDIGLEYEIKDFFNSYEQIKYFQMFIDEDNIYNISVRLNKYNLFEAKKIFISFLTFIEYSKGSFYIRNENKDTIEYTLVSFKDNFEGFCCKVEFYL